MLCLVREHKIIEEKKGERREILEKEVSTSLYFGWLKRKEKKKNTALCFV